MSNVPKMFGSLVFNETVMKDRLPTATYKTFKNAVLKGEALDLPIANIIANAMTGRWNMARPILPIGSSR